MTTEDEQRQDHRRHAQEDYRQRQIKNRRVLLAQYLGEHAGKLMLRDWRGFSYTVGDTVLFPRAEGRCVEMAIGEVLDLYMVYRNDDWKWTRITPSQAAQLGLDVYLEWRARIQPEDAGSRFQRWSTGANWLNNYTPQKNAKPITLIHIQNLTVVPFIYPAGPAESPYDNWTPDESSRPLS